MTDATGAVRQLLQRLSDAWNAGDAAGYADLFTEDADYITFFGLRMRGRTAIEEGHRELFRMPITLEPLAGTADVKPLAEGAVLVIAGGSSTVDGQVDPNRDSVISLTAVDTPEGWRFASFQNTRASGPRG
ncbi:SgcJ/EcaC family oxidoreductase [Nonomuraea longispora]|uniref:SgcJ/EcaC family oxidoreductase n=1 Tax=Nonomuraea longispora TaxID=1848320 RepID=A0A4R4N6R3_9ACTN|nr:SgcJ/EcaC family oxidoreductase [Nonomuraea longispora]TDC03684.1 SgcJ/EcaC family oxidoreductase [Nonomuraea longispora]